MLYKYFKLMTVWTFKKYDSWKRRNKLDYI